MGMTQNVPDADRVGIGTASQRERVNVKETAAAEGWREGGKERGFAPAAVAPRPVAASNDLHKNTYGRRRDRDLLRRQSGTRGPGGQTRRREDQGGIHSFVHEISLRTREQSNYYTPKLSLSPSNPRLARRNQMGRVSVRPSE